MPTPATSVPRSYAGIGSRETPRDVLTFIEDVAAELGRQGWCLRSGGAPGADDAFERGSAAYLQEIFLPWKGFNGRKQGLILRDTALLQQAHALAAQHHPYWMSLKPAARSLMARNACQVLGRDLAHPATFVLCWGKRPQLNEQGQVIDVDGGTGLAVRLAVSRGIPVYDLILPEHRQRVEAFLSRRQLQQETPPSTTTMPPRARL